jgi:hypothetical protein
MITLTSDNLVRQGRGSSQKIWSTRELDSQYTNLITLPESLTPPGKVVQGHAGLNSVMGWGDAY